MTSITLIKFYHISNNTLILVQSHYRQAIPLALVQADTLAIAKQPSNTNKSNATTNNTSSPSNATEKNQERSPLVKVTNLQGAPLASSPSQAVWRFDHLSYSNYGPSDDQGTVVQDQKSEEASEMNNCDDDSSEGKDHSNFVRQINWKFQRKLCC